MATAIFAKIKRNNKEINRILTEFSPGSNLQKYIDMEVARHSDPYVPSDTTTLRKSVFVRTNFGSGEIIYEIYGNPDGKNTWNDTTSKFQDAPIRGAFWVTRMLDAGGAQKLLKSIYRFMEKFK